MFSIITFCLLKFLRGEQIHAYFTEDNGVSVECEAILQKKKQVVSALRQELSALEETFGEELTDHRQKREELVRRLAEHASELHAAACDAVCHLQVSDMRYGLCDMCVSPGTNFVMRYVTASREPLLCDITLPVENLCYAICHCQ